MVFWPRLGDLFVFQNPKGVYVFSPGQMLGYAYTICSYGQISISYTTAIGSPCLPSCV